MYTLLIAIIYLAFISLGLPDSLLGAGWDMMRNTMQVPVSYMGIISMVISGGTIISSLFSDLLTKKFGTHTVTIVSVLLTAGAMFGFAFSNKFWELIVFGVPYGLGAGAIDASLNNYVALHYKSKHMSWLHCFWGVGAIVSPFIMGYAISKMTWHSGYLIVACIQLCIGLLLIATVRAWRVNPVKVEEKQNHIGILSALKIKGVPLLLIGFFAYCAAEATTMYWASTYFVQAKGLTAEKAAFLASLFYIGITAGRFLSGFITDKLGDRKMIILGTSVLSLGIVFLAIPIASSGLAIAGFLIIGFGCAPIYPCIIHSAPANFGEENSGAIIGLQMACAYSGSTFMPPLYGLISGATSFKILPLYIAIFFALMIAMTESTFRITRRQQNMSAD